jgi:glycosyltransferase involved in cell wall biosynthesis
MKLLSILVPTFNRDSYLERLLCELSRQIKESDTSEIVEVLIADNASSDNTKSIVNSHLSSNTNFSCIRHSTNIGAESNLISLLESASGKFFWFIGDDDLPVAGLIKHVTSQLNSLSPSLLYLPSVWAPDISSINLDQSEELSFAPNTPLKTAQDLYIWTTFISSWIFNAQQAFSSPSSLRQIVSLKGSNLPQLGWIIPLLVQSQSNILVASRPCILATSGNTGGYAILRTFIVNYPALVCRYTSDFSRMRFALIGKTVRFYLPTLIVSVRIGKSYRNAGDSAGIFSDSLRFLWYYPSFWLLCLPALFIPVELAQFIRSLVSIVTQIYQQRRKLI